MRAAAALSVLAALVAAGCGGDEQKPIIAANKTAVVRGELVPDVHLFGEPVVAHVDVILNRDRVDPAEVQLRTDFEPYEQVGETRDVRRDIAQLTAQQRWPLLELRTLGLSLEDLFIRVVAGEEHEEAMAEDAAPASTEEVPS